MNEQTTTASGSDAALDLDRVLQVVPVYSAQDTFVGAGRDYGPLGIYGGHLLGQALAAAFATVAVDRLAHALHAHFLAPGAPSEPIRYHVARLRDGRNYVTRTVQASQHDRLLMVASVSFKAAEPGDEHQPPMPAAPPPETLIRRRRAAGRAPLTLPFADGAGVTLEPVNEWSPAVGGPHGGRAREPAIRLWMRAEMSEQAASRERQCALAYLSDNTLMFNALLPHGRAFPAGDTAPSHRAASLDHSLWFHRDGDPGRWLLFDQRGPVAADARGLNLGHLFDRRGRLIASVAQEAMMRRLRPGRVV